MKPVTRSDLETLQARLREIDPDLVLAADEVDEDLLDSFSALTPRERLDRAARVAAGLNRLRRAERSR
jgi:hypothetical protein